MLKAFGLDPDGTPYLFLGLETKNLERLQADDPIRFVTPRDLPAGTTVVIFWGHEAVDLPAKLKEMGVDISEAVVKVVGVPRETDRDH